LREKTIVNKFPYGSLKYVGGDIKTAEEVLMKKVLVVLIFGVVFFGVFPPQNANAQNVNIAQKIIGTWVEQNGDTWEFKANGTLMLTKDGSAQEYKFGVTDTKLAMFRNGSDYFYDISISSDGKTLILDNMSIQSRSNSGILSAVYGGTRGYWLTKK